MVNLVTIGVCFECYSIGSPAEQIVTEVAGFDECLLSAKVYIGGRLECHVETIGINMANSI